jgi:rhodanese-related sulfurtransferase
MKQIGAKQLGEKKLTAKETVRDVRHPRDYKIEHIPGATNKPLEAFDTYKQEIEDYDTIYIYCNTGIDSRKFAKLTQEYQTNIINIKDGILDRKKHYPVEIIKARPTLIQQVHTAAGILILVGI